MQRAQRHGHVIGLVAATLVLYWVDDHDRIHEGCQRCPHGWIQVGEVLLSRPVQLPSVHASDAEPGPDLFPGHPLLSRWRPLVLISVHQGQELPLAVRVAPGVRLEPLAPYRLHQRCQVALLTSLHECCVGVLVILT
jgi:hypothetical protein